jgi:hypothetical protein
MGIADEDDHDDITIKRMEKLLKIKKGKKGIEKEFASSGLDFLLNYKEDIEKDGSDDERPEEVSMKPLKPGLWKCFA